jgi:hypothetical protein
MFSMAMHNLHLNISIYFYKVRHVIKHELVHKGNSIKSEVFTMVYEEFYLLGYNAL